MPPRKTMRKRYRGSPSSPPGSGGGTLRPVAGPLFAQPEPTADQKQFKVKHPSDDPAYIDALNRQHKIQPLPFPPPRGASNRA
jgi:hypothetical protein